MFKKVNKDKLRIISQILFLAVFIILFRNRVLQRWIIIFAGGVIISLLFSRFYCGWICPIGTLMRFQSWLYRKMGIKRLKVPAFMKSKWLRWLWLILFVTSMVAVKRFGLKINMLLYITLLGVIITFLFEEELWHKYICPYGTILNISSRPARLKMIIDKDKCTGCGLCQKECINNTILELADGKRGISNKECLLCFKCQEVCPVDAVEYGKEIEIFNMLL